MVMGPSVVISDKKIPGLVGESFSASGCMVVGLVAAVLVA